MKKNMVKKLVLGSLVAVAFLVVFAGCETPTFLNKKAVMNPEAAKAKMEKFINEELLQGKQKVQVEEFVKEGDLYRAKIKVGEQELTAYLTTDGKTFFPQAVNIDEVQNKDKNPSQPQKDASKPAPADITPQAVPDVKLFVMSYCPYGTQIEKGILPVLQTLGNKIKFNLEFVNYSMHNDLSTGDRKELDENLRQYCIQKNQPDKLNPYLTCFLKSQEPGQETSCMTSAGVNATQVASCMTQADTQFDVTKNFKDQSTYQGQFPLFNVNKEDNAKYDVQGSPTLVVNGTTAESGRDSQSLLAAICQGFMTKPKECDTALSATAPNPGFGEGTAASSGSASCGN